MREFNHGMHCGTNNISCGYLDLCPNAEVTAKVMSANMAGCPASGNNRNKKNIESIVTKFGFRGLSILLSGDFEDLPSGSSAQEEMVDFHGDDLSVEVYHAAHHGAIAQANKVVWLNGTKPKAVVSSGDPFRNYYHPRCDVFDRLIRDVGSLCTQWYDERLPEWNRDTG